MAGNIDTKKSGDKIKSSLPSKTSGKHPRYPQKSGTELKGNWKNANGIKAQK